ncbi:MAG: AraC family transcriptional regulator [Deltaproteobacteria bacterium]|nr:AraC family transcriptional regulator [Deltaproteobacteria bacterium]
MSNLKESLARLAAAIKEKTPEEGSYPTAIPGVSLHCRYRPFQTDSCFLKPLTSLIAQGKKISIWGQEELRYGQGDYLVNSMYLPSTSFIKEASPANPFLAITLDLDSQILAQLALEIPEPPPTEPGRAVLIYQAEEELIDAYLRLLQLLAKPASIPVLGPLIVNEIHYRLLIGPSGSMLRSVNHIGGQSYQVAKAITWLKENFKQPLRVEDLAKRVNMAPSTFHRHFRIMTTLTPLNYQKRLRLYEAQRLMMIHQLDALVASQTVGYESPSQFNREYKRLFGEPPRRDVARRLKMAV